MASYQIFLNGVQVDYGGKPIALTKQVNLIGDLSQRQTSYTSQISIPRTVKNIAALDYLNIQGATSRRPYEKVTADVYVDFVPIVRNGYAVINSVSSKEYKLSIYEGNIDLHKAVGDKKLSDMQLDELSHTPSILHVVRARAEDFTSAKFSYFIADYGGETTFNETPWTYINLGALMPSANCKYIWDKIFQQFGFKYRGNIFTSSDFQNLHLSTAKALEQQTEAVKTILVNITNLPGNRTAVQLFYIFTFTAMWQYKQSPLHEEFSLNDVPIGLPFLRDKPVGGQVFAISLPYIFDQADIAQESLFGNNTLLSNNSRTTQKYNLHIRFTINRNPAQKYVPVVINVYKGVRPTTTADEVKNKTPYLTLSGVNNNMRIEGQITNIEGDLSVNDIELDPGDSLLFVIINRDDMPQPRIIKGKTKCHLLKRHGKA